MTGALSPADGVALARLAADAVAAVVSDRELGLLPPAGSPLWAIGASFVTLERAGALRGCIGTVEASRPLCRDVIRNAQGASRDPRLPPVTAGEWAALDVKVSVLSGLEPIEAGSREDLASALRPGSDGVLLSDGDHRATFLPAVWHKVADPNRFVSALLAKGGWSPGGWPSGLRAWRYTCQEYADRAPRSPLPG